MSLNTKVPAQPYLLLYSNDAADLLFAQAAAIEADFKVVHCQSIEVFLSALAGLKEIAAVLISASTEAEFLNFQTAVMRDGRISIGKLNPNNLHFISDLPIDAFRFLPTSPFFGNILSRKRVGEPWEIGARYGRLMKAAHLRTELTLLDFLGKKAKIQKSTLTTSDQQKGVSAAVLKIGSLLGSSPRIAEKAALVAEELLMNAIFDAPVNEEGVRLHQRTARESSFILGNEGKVDFELGFNQNTLGFRITDYFGSLHRQDLLYHLAKRSNSDSAILNEDREGAGLGLAASYQTNASFLFRIHPKMKTDIFVLFPKAKNVRQLKSEFRFLCTDYWS